MVWCCIDQVSMPKTKKQKIGAWGEEKASLFLSEKKYEIIERNFSGVGGEIDIIAWHQKPYDNFQTLCFIEVKTRSGERGSAERAVNFQKKNHLSRVAKNYCFAHGVNIAAQPICFEVVAVYGDENDFDIEHYEGVL